MEKREPGEFQSVEAGCTRGRIKIGHLLNPCFDPKTYLHQTLWRKKITQNENCASEVSSKLKSTSAISSFCRSDWHYPTFPFHAESIDFKLTSWHPPCQSRHLVSPQVRRHWWMCHSFPLLPGLIYHNAFYKLVFLNSHHMSMSFDLYKMDLIYESLR